MENTETTNPPSLETAPISSPNSETTNQPPQPIESINSSTESKTNYQDLINNLNNPDKIQEATKKEVNAKETYKKFKEFYFRVSHDDYYAAKSKLDQNVELKKSLRNEMRKIEPLKDKPTLTNEEAKEVQRINDLIDTQQKVPQKEKILAEKLDEIEEQLRKLRLLVKDSFE
jgi:hypothetical protein